MWRLSCLLVLWFQPYMGDAQFGNDLGQQIFQQVHESLRGTENLGERITANVQQSLGAVGFPHMDDLSNLGQRITANVHKQLHPLKDLGKQIHSQVHQNLLPVYALTIKTNMANGVGGTTVATYHRNQRSRVFIIQNGVRYICRGRIQGPRCLGSLDRFTIENREDFCYSRSYAYLDNEVICLAPGSLDVQIQNNQIECHSGEGAPVLKLSQHEYQQLCGNRQPGHITYIYYADPNNPRAIPIPNPNPHVTCLRSEPGICEFEESQSIEGGSGGVSISSSSGINVNYYNN